ncbi:unnamed protein product, partial [Symbiodinium natans]
PVAPQLGVAGPEVGHRDEAEAAPGQSASPVPGPATRGLRRVLEDLPGQRQVHGGAPCQRQAHSECSEEHRASLAVE